MRSPLRAATSTHHEWLEDSLLPNKDAINDASIIEGETATLSWATEHADTVTIEPAIGTVTEGDPRVVLVTAIGGERMLEELAKPEVPREIVERFEAKMEQ